MKVIIQVDPATSEEYVEFHVKEITDKMIESYSKSDFKVTHLFAAMLNWAKRMNVNLC